MKYLQILMVAALMVSCHQKTKKEKAADAIEVWMKENVDDPKSYQPGNFNFESVGNGWDVEHEYRTKNAFGATVKETGRFHVDSNYFLVDPLSSEPAK
jgi:hypothetical protein